jgi:hypothetical protein
MATINIGNLAFTHKGDYDGSTAYAKNDVVYYSTNGNAYIAKQATTGNAPTNATYWNQFAQGSGGIWSGALSLGTAGQVVKVNSGASALEFGDAGGGYQSMQVFTSNGTYTKPSGINKIKVTVTGGGGSGGDGSGNYNTGGGGGGGGTAIKTIDATSITTETVTIGAAGAANSQGHGNAGATSSFGSHCSATGGGGGVREGNGGDGGAGSNGDINIRGGAGGQGGGGQTGDESPGNSYGGSTIFGIGGACAHNTTGGRKDAIVYGTGGGGGDHDGSNFSGAGVGHAGVVIVEEYK